MRRARLSVTHAMTQAVTKSESATFMNERRAGRSLSERTARIWFLRLEGLRDVREGFGDCCAEGGDRNHCDGCDEGDDETVFDERGAVFVGENVAEILEHDDFLIERVSDYFFGHVSDRKSTRL